MEFDYTPEQEALCDSVRRFVTREYDWEERLRIIRSPTGVAADHWGTFAEMGWLGAGLSEELGGFGGGAVENALIAEELGRALVTEPFVAHVVATAILAAIADDAALAHVEQLVSGEVRIVPALQEAAGRGDWRVVDTQLREGRLHGAKTLVEGAASADRFLVSARTADGVVLCLVDAGDASVTRRDYRTLDNRRVADLEFDGTRTTVLASGVAAQAAIENGIEHGLVTLCGEALGIADAALWTTRDYLKVRRQFGTTIGNFQALQHRMADMLIETEMSRSALYAAFGAFARDDADARTAAVSAAKVQAGTGGLLVTGQAIQLHGGIGVTEELIVSHFYRRLYVIARQFGDTDLHLARFAEARDRAA
ncbi:MAG: acyl-CoA dehydrogenase [Novosphingobium sp.]